MKNLTNKELQQMATTQKINPTYYTTIVSDYWINTSNSSEGFEKQILRINKFFDINNISVQIIKKQGSDKTQIKISINNIKCIGNTNKIQMTKYYEELIINRNLGKELDKVFNPQCKKVTVNYPNTSPTPTQPSIPLLPIDMKDYEYYLKQKSKYNSTFSFKEMIKNNLI